MRGPIGVVAAVVVASCGSEPKRPSPTPEELLAKDADRPTRDMRVQRLIYPSEEPGLRPPLRTLDAPATADRRLWEANNLRIGVLPKERLALFRANLPEPLRQKHEWITTGSRPSPVTLVDDVEGTTRVALVGPEGERTTKRLTGGRYRLLLRRVPAPGEGRAPSLELLPDHQRDVVPGLPSPARKEGPLRRTPFASLKLRTTLRQGWVWVVWPGRKENDGARALSVGEALLTGRWEGRSVRIVLLLVPAGTS